MEDFQSIRIGFHGVKDSAVARNRNKTPPPYFFVKESIVEGFDGRKLQKIKALVRIDIKLIVTFNKHKELETLF